MRAPTRCSFAFVAGLLWAADSALGQPAGPSPAAIAASESGTIPVRFNDRVELLAIVFRLAGSPEYNKASGAYADAERDYFHAFAGHEVVKLAKEYRQKHGVSFDAVMSFAVHLKEEGPLTELKPKIDFHFNPERLDKRWNGERAWKFLEALNRFAAESKADRFIADHTEHYRKAVERLADPVNKKPYRAWLDSFFGAKPGAVFSASPGLLNGPTNYGVGVLYATGKEEITPVFGVGKFDAAGLPVFDDSVCATVVHEFCHSYTNPLIDKNIKTLGPSLDKLFPLRQRIMQQQAYGSSKIMGYESLVRACTVRFAVEKESKEIAAAQLADEHARGFLWTGELVELLGVYQLQRDKYPTFDSFMPEVIAFFGKIAADPQAQLKKLPRVVRTEPAANTATDPSLTEITIEFDRPMKPDSFSFVGDASQMPKVTGKPTLSTDGKSFILPVKLQPGKRYTLRLNSLQNHGFTSLQGFALEPMEFSFSTSAK